MNEVNKLIVICEIEDNTNFLKPKLVTSFDLEMDMNKFMEVFGQCSFNAYNSDEGIITFSETEGNFVYTVVVSPIGDKTFQALRKNRDGKCTKKFVENEKRRKDYLNTLKQLVQ